MYLARIRAKVGAHRKTRSVYPECKSMHSRKTPMARNKIVFSTKVFRILRQKRHKRI